MSLEKQTVFLLSLITSFPRAQHVRHRWDQVTAPIGAVQPTTGHRVGRRLRWFLEAVQVDRFVPPSLGT